MKSESGRRRGVGNGPGEEQAGAEQSGRVRDTW